MRLPSLLALSAFASALVLASPHDAAACGGCFHVPMDNTQVTYHRMILSVSQQQSTLYDEIKYAGAPSSFAWVLPIKGMVTVGLSSDALFAELDNLTSVQVIPPPYPCPVCPIPSGAETATASNSTGGGGPLDAGVTVISQGVVGPYEQVQLSSSSPTALADWLTMHGYVIPADIQPVVTAYVNEGFDFLALKLVPGMTVSAMQPVRVTTPGASPVLPLRMVAAGVGTMVPITLFVLGEGRYDTQNFPSFTIDPTKVVWDWSTYSSNYKALTQQGFTASSGKGWLVESAMPQSESFITSVMDQAAQVAPLQSGYADSMGMNAVPNEMADMTALFTGISASSLWITRLNGQLPRTALSTDLNVGASMSQTPISNIINVTKSVNPPMCTPCSTGAGFTTTAGAGGATTSGAGGVGGVSTTSGGVSVQGGGCGVAGDERASLPVVAGLAFLALRRRRRARV
jgi:hypothetical protein